MLTSRAVHVPDECVEGVSAWCQEGELVGKDLEKDLDCDIQRSASMSGVEHGGLDVYNGLDIPPSIVSSSSSFLVFEEDGAPTTS